MRAMEISAAGFGVKNLRLIETEHPTPGPGEVLLEMHAASLNYRDLLMVQGHYNPRQPLPLVPCSDGVGTIVACGSAVVDWTVGQRACPVFASGWRDGPPTPQTLRHTRGGPLHGTLSTHMVVAAADLVAPPEHFSHAEAACLPCAALTAWSALKTLGNLQPHERVLIQGTGGVALFALQIAVACGAQVIQTSSSDERLAFARSLGAWEGINYQTTPRWGRAVRSLTEGQGVDHIIELGGAGTLSESMQAIRPGGTISMIGVLAGGRAPVDITPLLMRQIKVQGVFVGHQSGFVALCDFLRAHTDIRPVISAAHPLEDAQSGLQRLQQGGHLGKVVIDLSETGSAH